MPGGKGKSTGGKAGPKEAAAKSQKSHSAKAGLQVSGILQWNPVWLNWIVIASSTHERALCINIDSQTMSQARGFATIDSMDAFHHPQACLRHQNDALCELYPVTPVLKLLLTRHHSGLVSLRPCEAFLEEQHPKQDARRSQRYVYLLAILHLQSPCHATHLYIWDL